MEARAVHEQLARMLEKGDPHLLGPNREHLGRVVKVFAVAMPTATLSEKLQLCTKETAAKMKAILMQMQGSVPPEQLQAAWGCSPRGTGGAPARHAVMETAEVERDRGGPNHESARAVRAFRSRRIGARAFFFLCDGYDSIPRLAYPRSRASSNRPPHGRPAWMSSHVCAQLA